MSVVSSWEGRLRSLEEDASGIGLSNMGAPQRSAYADSHKAQIMRKLGSFSGSVICSR